MRATPTSAKPASRPHSPSWSLVRTTDRATYTVRMRANNNQVPRQFYASAQIRELDRRAIEGGIAGYTLMQRAAAAAWRELLRRWPKAQRIAVLCGPGNNGGDGYEIARLAHAAGLDVELLQVGAPAQAGDAVTARKAWLANAGKAPEYRSQALTADVVVD